MAGGPPAKRSGADRRCCARVLSGQSTGAWGERALTGYFSNAGRRDRFQGLCLKGEPDAADWKFAVVSAGGAQRRTLLPSHTAYKIQLLPEQTREGAVEDAIFGVGKFRMLDWMGSEFGPLPRRHCGKGQRRSRALSIDPFFSPDCSRSAWGAAADSLMRSAASRLP
jgi:hypothetical protein